jgi:3-oxoacyl-[acyl-carrier-protein] synthase-3
MTAVYITGLGSFLPNEPVTNDDIEQVLGLVNGRSSQVKNWVLNYNGIKTRHYAVDRATGAMTHTNAQMTAEAVRRACADAALPLPRIPVLACGTSSADQVIPGHAVMVHGVLGNGPCEVVTTSGVCCSGMTAFKYGYMSVRSGSSARAVVAGSELASVSLRADHFRPEMEIKKVEDFQKEPMLSFENDFLRWMLSDGAGAMVLADEPRDDGLSLRVDWVDVTSYAHAGETCMYFGCKKLPDGSVTGFRSVDDPKELIKDGYLSLAQDVRVLREGLPKFFRESVMASSKRHGLNPEEIDWVLPHYSSEGFRDPLYQGLVAEGVNIPLERWFTNLTSKGNTGAASIYIILEELVRSGRAKQGDRIVCFIPESARFTFSFMHLTVV